MRQQFTYRLDEDKIRKELRSYRTSSAPEAYQRFCAYSDAHSRPVSKSSFPGFSMKLDRRFAVPAAAAVVLLVLSLVLANFAGNGKSDREAADLHAEPFVPAPSFEPETIIPQPVTRDLPEPVAANNDEGLQVSKPVLVREKKDSTDRKNDRPERSLPVAASLPGGPTGSIQAQTATTQAQTATTQGEVKKKERRDAALILEPVQLPDIRPTLLSTEQEEEIRTN